MRVKHDIESAYRALRLTSSDRELLLQEVYAKMQPAMQFSGERRLTHFENIAGPVDLAVAKLAESLPKLQKYIAKPSPALIDLVKDGVFDRALGDAIISAIAHYAEITRGDYYVTRPLEKPHGCMTEQSLLWPLTDDAVLGTRLRSSNKTALELVTISSVYGLTGGFSQCMGARSVPSGGWRLAADILTGSGIFSNNQLGELAARPELRQAMIGYVQSLISKADH
jgi:hypothetical protein